MEIVRRRLWHHCAQEEVIALQLPEEPSPMLVNIHGGDEGMPGFTIFRGSEALLEVPEFLAMETLDPDELTSTTMVWMLLGPREKRSPAELQWSRRAQYARPKVPLFLVKEPGEPARAPDRAEAMLLLRIVRALLAAASDSLLLPEQLHEEGYLSLLALRGDPLDPEITPARLDYSTISGKVEWQIGDADEIILCEPEGLARLNVGPSCWLVGMLPFPGAADADAQALVVVEEESGRFLDIDLLQGMRLQRAADRLLSLFFGCGDGAGDEIPHRILFSSDLLQCSFQALLGGRGVECIYRAEIPLFEELGAAFRAHAGEGPAGADPEQPPGSGDYLAWRLALASLLSRLDELSTRKSLWNNKSLGRFFGDTHERRDILDFDQAFDSFGLWVATSYRPKAGRRTTAEILLASQLPAGERALLEALVAAPPSLYSVRALEAGRTLTLTDIITGDELEVHDRILSRTISAGAFFGARIVAVGELRFALVHTPLVPPALAQRALSFLEQQGLEASRSGLAQGAHLLGRLWIWYEEICEPSGPHLTNTDGEDLVILSAAFSCGNLQALETALAGRPDIDFDEHNGTWIWNREEDPEEGRRTLLARIQVIGDTLVADLNSSERLEGLREWIEEIPGVAFKSVHELPADPRSLGQRPLDDRLGGFEPPGDPAEMAELMQREIRRHYLEWIDIPLPALKGKTPLEACQTERGRRQVQKLLRTFTSLPLSDGSEAKIPLEEMRRRLGLED